MTSLPGWPEPKYIKTNGIRMAVWEAGSPGRFPPLILCHGFPELACSWRHQLRGLAEAGFHVIAPDQRGYGLTDAPPNVEDYDILNLTADLVGLLDAYGFEKAVFVGHDWGGGVVWDMARRHPERVAGVVSLNTPCHPRPPVEPITMFRQTLGEDMYIVYFQEQGPADRLMGEDVAKGVSMHYRRPLPGTVNTSDGVYESSKENQNAELSFAEQFRNYDPATDLREEILTPEEKSYYIETYERTGFTGGLNWYRNLTRNWENSAHLSDRIELPSLIITSELDPYLPPSSSLGMEERIPNLSRHNVLGAGHWTQQERPEEVNETIVQWMKTTFSDDGHPAGTGGEQDTRT